LKIQYNTDIQKCILQLQSLSLPCNKLGQIIPTANENIFKVDIPKSPCRTTIQNIIDEGHYLSRKQVGSALTKTENWDLLADCTSRDGRKILDAILLSPFVHLSSFQLYLSSNLLGHIFSYFAVLFPFGFSLLLALHY
jgi:hypothetical protein